MGPTLKRVFGSHRAAFDLVRIHVVRSKFHHQSLCSKDASQPCEPVQLHWEVPDSKYGAWAMTIWYPVFLEDPDGNVVVVHRSGNFILRRRQVSRRLGYVAGDFGGKRSVQNKLKCSRAPTARLEEEKTAGNRARP